MTGAWMSGLLMRTAKSTLGAIAVVLAMAAPGFAVPNGEGDVPAADADEFADEFEAEEPAVSHFPDPLERINRGTLQFNRGIDRWVLDPVTAVYRFVLPSPARKCVLRFLINLDSPAVLANDLMQREWRDAGVTVGRFGINSTIGIAGLFDPATPLGLPLHISDFGQTLALEGVPSGAYLVVPLFGPYTVRDGLGDIVDIFLRPITFFIGPVDQIFYATIYGGSSGIALHDKYDKELDMLEESSVDFYAALRNAYYQKRTAEIWERRDDHESLVEVARSYWPSPPDVPARAEAEPPPAHASSR